MARYGRLLTDAQWYEDPSLAADEHKSRRGGRPPANDRKVFEGILWILLSGAGRTPRNSPRLPRVALPTKSVIVTSSSGSGRGC
jgi:hypothetical protein